MGHLKHSAFYLILLNFLLSPVTIIGPVFAEPGNSNNAEIIPTMEATEDAIVARLQSQGPPVRLDDSSVVLRLQDSKVHIFIYHDSHEKIGSEELIALANTETPVPLEFLYDSRVFVGSIGDARELRVVSAFAGDGMLSLLLSNEFIITFIVSADGDLAMNLAQNNVSDFMYKGLSLEVIGKNHIIHGQAYSSEKRADRTWIRKLRTQLLPVFCVQKLKRRGPLKAQRKTP